MSELFDFRVSRMAEQAGLEPFYHYNSRLSETNEVP